MKKDEAPSKKPPEDSVPGNEDLLTEETWIPIIPMRDVVLFPSVITPFFVGRKRSLLALEKAMSRDRKIFVVAQRKPDVNNPEIEDLFQIGVIGNVIRSTELPNNTLKIVFEGTQRGKLLELRHGEENPEARVLPMDKNGPVKSKNEADSLIYEKLIKSQLKNFLKRGEEGNESLEPLLNLNIAPEYLCNFIAPALKISLEEKQEILETDELNPKLEKIYSILVFEDESRKIDEKVRVKIQKQISKSHKEYFLNEQLRAIQKELGVEEQKNEFQEIEKKILSAGMTTEATEVAKKELKKLQQMSGNSSEASVIRNYIDWLLAVPWKEKTEDNLDLTHAQKILNKEHYGLTLVKDRILEFIAVSKRIGRLKSPILCLVGPPGVGKTSLAKSVAHALGRNFVRMSLGGIRDEAEIRGHRRTYIGAMPGKILHAMKKAKSINPVLLLDEVDKMNPSHMGDPAAALLEALDKEQNFGFMDHYLEVEYDLSRVLFFCTANSLEGIPIPLRDRMEVIVLPGYAEIEKLSICVEYLVPKQLEENALPAKMISLKKPEILEIIRSYTKEGGIRELERLLAKIYRKVNRELLENKKVKKIDMDTKKLAEYLGPAKFQWGKKENKALVGIVNGLAWSPYGGDILTIEVIKMPGKGKLVLTGQLGSVMKESASAAYSFVRSNAAQFGIPLEIFHQIDLHVHAPEGAIPKDGPSAGVSLATALVSMLTKNPVKKDLAMTGEITLRGRVLKIGGLKEKILAAIRAKIKTIFIPEENEPDLIEIKQDLPEELKKVQIVPFHDLFSLVKEALEKPLVKIKDPKQQATTALGKEKLTPDSLVPHNN